MDSTRPRRIGWTVAVVALVLLALVSAARSISPKVALGTKVTLAQCQAVKGGTDYCFRHVERADWLLLAPVDDYQVYVKGRDGHHSVGNPWMDDAQQRVILEEGGLTLTDGQVAVHFTPEMLQGIGE
ncbi:hypothetical protein AB0J80_32995 [Actinoplanes sp. NPDC049548]|uniref:hypothetical protein n=1 Tax=Actinoplanes sp. NPDC049548 TaxID=3155152 RepID=UPI0034301C57